MIYLKMDDGRELIILEPGNLERLKQGKMGKTPDGRIALVYTPDMPWLAAALTAAAKSQKLTPEILSRLIEESQKRKVVMQREPHPVQKIVENGNLVREDA